MTEITRQMNDWVHNNPGEGAGLMVDAVCEITRLRRELHEAMASLIAVERTNLGAEVQLPLFYPNGDMVAVTVSAEQGAYVIHDAGNGVMLLNSHGMELTKKLKAKISSLASQYGCEFEYDRVSRRCTLEDLAICAAIVANASRSVGDQILYQQERPAVDFSRDVIERAREAVGSNRIRENETFIGDSGYEYHVTAVILTEDQDHVASLLEPVKDHNAVTMKFRRFWDISKSDAHAGASMLSVYDDEKNWNGSDLILLQGVSRLVPLSDTVKEMRVLLNA